MLEMSATIHTDAALRRFANAENLRRLADDLGYANPQVLRNKFAESHSTAKPSIFDLVQLTRASGNHALIEGVLADLNMVGYPVEALSDEPARMAERALNLSSASGDLSRHAIELTQGKPLNQRTRDALIGRAHYAVRELMMLMSEVEHKFQAVPCLSCAVDAIQSMPMPGVFG